jgi:hypothetical protein
MSYPKAEAPLVIWYKNFGQSLATHAATLGLTAADVAAAQADGAMLNYLIGDLVPTFQTALQARVSFKNLMKDGPIGAPGGDPPPAPAAGTPPTAVAPGILPRLRQLIQRIKTSPNYTEAIGQALDIIGSDGDAPDGDTKARPTAKAIALPMSQVRIEFTKRGFDGVVIESRRTGEENWTLLGTDNFSPYIDTRPPVTAGRAEVREYRLRFLRRDEPVGEWSDIISVSTQP